MTKLLPYATYQNSGADMGQQPGAAPNGAQMQGNPASAQAAQDQGNYPPGPQVGGAAQVLGVTPATHDQISRGNVPLNAVPTSGVAQQTGTDSLLAQIARGQVSLNQTNYGQPVQVPKEAGTGPQGQPFAQLQPLPSQAGSSITVAAAPNYIGD